MVRPYAVKGRKRKKRDDSSSSSSYKLENEEEILNHEEEIEDEEDEKIVAEAAEDLPRISITTTDVKSKGGGVIFVLEKASLEVAKVGKTYQILTSDDHANFIRKNKKDPADYRPDIVHQVAMAEHREYKYLALHQRPPQLAFTPLQTAARLLERKDSTFLHDLIGVVTSWTDIVRYDKQKMKREVTIQDRTQARDLYDKQEWRLMHLNHKHGNRHHNLVKVDS